MMPPDGRDGPAGAGPAGPADPVGTGPAAPADSPHADVGAYALGVLGDDEAVRFEEHLADCERCADELDRMLALAAVLDEARGEAPEETEDATALLARPRPELLDRLLAETTTRRRSERWRRVLVAAVAVLLIGGGSGVAVGALGGGDGDGGEDGGRTGAEGVRTEFQQGEKHQGVDPATKVEAAVSLAEKPWGTHVTLRLGNLRGPRECDLVAVGRNGERQTVSSWSVPKYGYGIEGTKWDEPLYITGGAALTPDRIDRFEVRTLDGERLAAVPL